MAALTFPTPTQLKNIQDPSVSSDAATKNYVDTQISSGGVPAAGSNTQVQFNNANAFGASSNFTFDSTANLLTVTGNIVANYFSGNGNLLTSITGGNVTGTVANATFAVSANTVRTNAQPNITSVGTLSSLNVSGTITAANVTANTGRFTGNGSGLTNLAGANVTGTVANANLATYAGTVTGNSQSNITGLGNLIGLIVSNSTGVVNFSNTANVSLGNVSNLHIDGGSSGYVLKTDGAGNLSWGTDSALPGGLNTEVQFNSSSSFGTSSNFTFDTSYNGGAGSLSVGYTQGGAIFTDALTANVSITSNGDINTTANINSVNANLGNLTVSNYFQGNGSLLTSIPGANVTGTVANATFATSAGTVRTAAQPNITSTGTLSSLNVSGNITAPNIIANTGRFVGNGAGLTNLPGANVTGQVGNALIASTVYTNAQPNITSVGTLSSLAVTGNITAGNVTGANLVSANYLSGDGYMISNITVGAGSSIVNGNSNVAVAPNSNVIVSVSGTAGIVIVTSTGANVVGYLDVTGNITAGNVSGGNVVSANYFSGNGSLLTSITGSNVSGNVSTAVTAFSVSNGNSNLNIPSANGNVTVSVAGNSNVVTVTGTGVNVAGTLNTGAGNITAGNISGGNLVSANYFAGTLTTASQPNVTSLGSLTGLTVSNSSGVVDFTTTANVTLGNVSNLHVAGGSTGYYLSTDGAGNLAFVSPPGGGGISGTNTEVQFNDGGVFGSDGNFTFNKTTDTLSVKSLTLQATGNLTGGNLVSANYITGTLTTANQSNITTVGNLTNLDVAGNATIAGNLTVSGTTIYANITVLNVKDPIIEMGGNPNGTPLNTNDGKDRGTLLHYYVTANATAVDAFMGWDNSGGEFVFGSNVTNSSEVITVNDYGNVHAAYYIGNASQLTGIIANANYAAYSGVVTSSSQPNITSVGTLTSLGVTGNITAGNISGGNLVSANYLTGTLTTNAQPNITSLGSLSSLTVSGNATANNMNVTNDVHVLNLYAGNLLAANYFSGDGSALSNVSASGGNATTALTASYVSGNIQANITSVGTLTSLTVANSGTGNITSDNANLGNLAIANYFQGNGSLLTSITGANVTGTVANANYATYAGTVLTNSQPNITSVGTLTGLTITSNGNITLSGSVSGVTGANLVSASYLTGTLTTAAQPNITSFGTVTGITLTGAATISGGNLLSANYLTGTLTTNAQPNITSVGTLGSLGVTGNITAGNVTGANLISANYFSGDGSLLTNISVTAGNSILNGNSNVVVTANSNVTVSVAGNSDIVTVTGTGVNVAGYLSTGTGNITSGNANLGNAVRGNFFIGNGALLTDITGGNVTGTVANANYSTYAGTVLTNAQPNITSVGTLTSLGVTGNITAGNVTGANLISANYISGNGNLLTSITGANVTGTVANATYATSAGGATTAGTVTTNAQPNITSVGTLSSLAVTGNITAGNLTGANLISGNYLSGDGYLISNLTVGAGSSIINGNSNVSVSANSNVTVGVAGVADIVIISDTGVNVAGYLNIDIGNITAGNASLGNLTTSNYFSGNGSLLTSIAGGNVTGFVANATVANTVRTNAQPNITSVGTLNSLSVTANISSGNANLGNAIRGNFFIGNGSLLTAITGANISGTVANANYSLYAGTVLTNAQPNITSVGTLSSLSVTGNITAGNVTGANLVSANYLSGDGYLISNITVAAGSSIVNGNSNVTVDTNSNVTITVAGNANIVTVTDIGVNVFGYTNVAGNITSENADLGNLTTSNYFSGNGSLLTAIAAGNISGTVANANYSTYAGTVLTNSQPNITSVGTLGNLSVTSNITTGNLTGANLVSANYLTGTLTTAAQPNITSVGTLSSLTVTSNGNITLSGSVSRVTGANLVSATYLTGTLTTAAQPNITSLGTVTGITMAGAATISGGNLVSANYVTGTLTTAAQPNITSVGTLNDTTLGASNSLSGGNLLSANYLTGTLTSSNQPNVTTLGTLTNLDVGGNATIAGNLTVSGTTIYANITTLNVKDPIIEMGGNPNGDPLTTNDGKDRGTLLHYYVTANSSPVDAFMGWDNSGAEFIFGSNVTNSNDVIAVNNYGNVRANYFLGNASQLTGTIANANYAAYAGTVLTNAQPNITSLGTLSNTTLGASNSLTGGNLLSANFLTGTLTTAAQPNITSVGTLGSLDITGNLSSGNANLGNSVTANYFTGNGINLTNIAGANVSGTVANANYALYAGTVLTNSQPNITSVGTLGSLSVTGNVSSGNANLGNLVSANYFSGDATYLTNVPAGSQLLNGNSNVYVNANANVTISSNGVSNIIVVTSTGVNVSGYLNAGTGNITSGNATLGNLTTSNYFSGDGSLLTSITGANVTGTVANATYATSAGSATTAGTVTTNAQPNITSVGTLSSLSITGNLTSGNANLGNLATANYFSGDGSLLTSITGANVTGTVANATYAISAGSATTAGTVTTNAQPNITSVGTLSSLAVTGTTTSGNFATAGNVTASFLVSNVASGTAPLTVSSNTKVTNLNADLLDGYDTATAATANTVVVRDANANVTANTLNTTDAIISGNATVTGNLTVNGTTIYANVTTLNVKDPIIEMGGNPNGDPLTTNDGKDRGTLLHYYSGSSAIDAFMGWDNSNAEFAFGSNVTLSGEVATFNTFGNVRASYFLGNGSQLTGTIANANYSAYAGTVLTNAQPNITSVGTLSSLAVTGTTTSGNFATAGNVTASFLVSNVATGTAPLTVSSTTKVTNLNADLLDGYDTDVANTANTVAVRDANGNISANYFTGNGYYLTGISTSSLANGNSNIVVENNANVTISSTGTANVVSVSGTGVNIAGTLNIGSGQFTTTGNANVANLNASTGIYGTIQTASQTNITTLGTLTNTTLGASNSLTGGNLVSANYLTGTLTTNAQPNITSLGTLSSLSVTGTTTSGNFATAGNVTASFLVSNIATGTAPLTVSSTTKVTNLNADLLDGYDTATAATADTVVVRDANANITGNNITGTLTTAAQPNITSLGTLASLSVTGTTTSGNFATAGNITASFLVSNVATGTAPLTVSSTTKVINLNADLLDGYDTAVSATANTVTVRDANGNVTANYFTGNGYYLTGISTSGLANGNSNIVVENNANVTISSNGVANVVSVTGTGVNITGTLNIGSGQFTTTGNANVANLNASTGIYGTIQTASQTNITTLGTLNNTTLGASNTFTGGNLVSANYITGTLTTNAQPNITSLGTLTSLTVTGTTTSGNFATAGNVTASFLVSNVASGTAPLTVTSNTTVTNLNADLLDGYDTSTSATANTVVVRDANGNITGNNLSATNASISGNATITGNLTVNGTTIYANVTTLNVKDPIIEMGGNPNGDPLTTNDGKDRGTLLHYYTGSTATDAFMGWDNSNAEFAFGSNVTLSSEVATFNTFGNVRASYFLGNGSQLTGTIANANYSLYAGTVLTNSQPNITSVGTLIDTTLGASNTFTGGNLVGANYLTGTLTTNAQPNITSLGTLASLSVTGTTTSGNFATAGNITASFLVSNIATGTAPLTVASTTKVTNLNADLLDGYDTATAATANTVVIRDANANITGNYFVGNGSQLTGTVANANYAAYAGTVLTNAQPNITSVGTLTGLTVSGGLVATGTGYVKTSNIQDSSGTITIVTGHNAISGDVGIYGNLTLGTSGVGGLTTYGITATGNVSLSGPNVTLGDASNLHIAGGTANYFLQTDGAGNLTWAAGGGGGGGGTPGGANTYVQFNDAGSFAGNANLTFNKTTGTLFAGNITTGSGSGGNISGANVITANTYVGNISTAAQPNITSLGNLLSLTVTGLVTLNSNANLKITGGSLGETLVTDGAGNLTWAATGATGLYEFDDLSYSADGSRGTFQLTYNQVPSTLSDPFSILVAVNGSIQPAFVWNVDVIWQSFVLGAFKGYTIIDTGYITFSSPPPTNSDIMVRTQSGVSSTNVKKYPFSPADIMFGY